MGRIGGDMSEWAQMEKRRGCMDTWGGFFLDAMKEEWGDEISRAQPGDEESECGGMDQQTE